MPSTTTEEIWRHVHAGRAALADDLAALQPGDWQHRTLCGRWDVEEVVAHLTAAASTGSWRWIRSMVGARFRAGVHNDRRLAEHRGRTPTETLARFRAVVTSTTAPSPHLPAYLGEVLVHSQDIRQPLGLARTPDVAALTVVAEFFAARDFTVPSRTLTTGLRLRADDGPFDTGGPGAPVTGSTLALVMTMAARAAYLDQLGGPGAHALRARVEGEGQPIRERNSS